MLSVQFRYLQSSFPHVNLWVFQTAKEESQVLFCYKKNMENGFQPIPDIKLYV